MHIAPWCIATGLISFTTTALFQRISLYVIHDGWQFWQGAVSIAEGCGYRDFLGHRLYFWPPLYSLYLAAWSTGGGTSVSIAWADSLLLGVQGAAWMWFTLKLWMRTEPRPSWAALGALVVFFGLFLPLHQQSVQSERLLYALLPLFLVAVWQTATTTGPPRGAAAAAVVLAALLIATHHRTAVFIAGGAAILLWPGAGRDYGHRRIAVVMLAVSVLTWLAIRQGLGQWDSHVIALSAARDVPFDYLRQTVRSIGNLLSSGTVDPPRLAILLHAAGLAFLLTRRIPRTPILTALILMAACASLTLALFHVVAIDDDIGPRFLLFVPLLSVPALILGADAYRRAALVMAATVVLLPLVMATSSAVIAAGDPHRGDPAEIVIHPSRLSPAYAFGPPRASNGSWLIAPPVFGADEEPSSNRCQAALDGPRDR